MLRSFPPVINGNTTQLVVGTMPGKASLLANEYYAYKQNVFWRIIFDVFKQPFPPLNYQTKIDLILKHNIGLWDSLFLCDRKSSLDKDIVCEKPNDFITLLKEYPKIKKLIFNGQMANKYFLKYFGRLENISYVVLPSTSPANASVPYKEKLKLWKTEILINKTLI